MRIKDGFVLRQIIGQYVVVGEGLSQVNFNKMLSLNESAAYLWKELQGRDFTVEDATALLLDRYEVDEEIASRDAAALCESWQKAGVLE